MRLLNWLKRDARSKRRQSAPPIGSNQEFDPNATRNQEYIRALEKFNEWRSQRLETSALTSTATNNSDSLLPIAIPEGPEYPMDTAVSGSKTNKGRRGSRLSLPAIKTNSTKDVESKSSSKAKGRKDRQNAKKSCETSIMEESPYKKDDEVRLFEELHCRASSGAAFEVSAEVGDHCSPPRRFYKKNAKPYHEKLYSKTPTATNTPGKSDLEYATPRRSNAPEKPTRRKKGEKGDSGPIPKIRNSLNCSKSRGTETDSMSEPSHFNGSYKHYDINSSSMYDEFVVSSKGYKGKLNQSQHTYQQVVNKHGDVVEYAMPLVDDGETQSSPDSKMNNSTLTRGVKLIPEEELFDEQLIDENFKFLTDKCNLNFSDSVRKFIFEDPSRNRQVTDLDQSVLEKADYSNQREIFNELDALGRWAESIDPQDVKKSGDGFNLNEFLFRNDTVIAYPGEIISRTSVLRSSIPMPVDLSSGIFHNTNVAVRKHLLEDARSIKFSQEALRRDFTILKQVRHANIMTLMAVVAERSVNQMQLILEPFDFTLNYYIHCQNNELSLPNVIIVMQQIGQAVNYLQESGWIHSNISSHSVLMRPNPLCVKLGFFELATEINTKGRREILAQYGDMIVDPFGQDIVFNTIPDYSLLLRGSEKYAKEKYAKLSKNINLSKVNQSALKSNISLEVPAKYLPYFMDYRQQFSLYFYQAPELISTKSRFVLPNTLSDVYSLTLLLWEMLNNCVPYVIYSYSELDKLYKSKQAVLPRICPERCERFEMILKMGLEKDPLHRVMSMQDFIALLDDAKSNVYDVVKKVEPVTGLDSMGEMKEVEAKENPNVNEIIYPKLATKAPFVFKMVPPLKNNHYENHPDLQLRMENAITDISLDTFATKSTTTCGDFSCAYNETLKDDREEERRAAQRTNGELSGGLGKGFTPKPKKRFSFKDRKSIVKRPSPTRSTAKRSADNLFNLSQSTIFNSASDIGKSPKQDLFVALERTSTLKRKKPVSRIGTQAANILQANGADSPKSRICLEQQLREMDQGLQFSKDDLLEEFRSSPKPNIDPKEFEQVQSAGNVRVNPNKGMVARARAKYMKRLLFSNGDEGGDGDSLSKTMKTPNNRITDFKMGSVPNSCPASYKFSIDPVSGSQTPIARNNRQLKHAWLSEQKLEEEQPAKVLDFESSRSKEDLLNRSFTVATQVADELKDKKILSIEKVYRNPNSSSCNISLDESFKEKNVNVSLKIIHNNLEIFNNSMGNTNDLNQKIQNIQLGMFEKEGCQSSQVVKPEIKIKLTPSKNGVVALNELNAADHPIGKQITDLTSEIRQCFENYNSQCDFWDSNNKQKLMADLVKEAPLNSPKLLNEEPQNDQEHFRFENTLWHREKSICEKSSAASAENLEESDWISVPLAIKRFESLFKSSSESPRLNKSVVNPAELSVVQQSRLPGGGGGEVAAENSPCPTKEQFNGTKCAPVATSSPLVEENIRRFNSFLQPIRLLNAQPRTSLGSSTTTQCCSSRDVVRRSTTFTEKSVLANSNRADRPRRITTKVTLNLKKVQPSASVNNSRISETGRNDSLVCRNCGTYVPSHVGSVGAASNGNLSTSMISYSTTAKAFDKLPESLSRRSSSCSTLLKMNPMDDLYIDDDYEDNSFLTPNIELVKNDDHYVIQFDD